MNDGPILVETIKYKKCQIEIFQDFHPQSPDDWGDENLFLVGFHSDFWVQREGFEKDVCRTIVNPTEWPDYKYEAKNILKKYHMFRLEAYIHSGVSLALSYEGNFPDRRWDVSQLGCVFVAREEWKDRRNARKAARGLVEEWNDYLSGNVYGYQATDPDKNVDLDSCWGFYGDYRKSGILDEAKASIDHYAKNYQATHYEI